MDGQQISSAIGVKPRKRIAGGSLVNPHLKRRKVPKGVDFVGEERDQLQVVRTELQQKQQLLEKEQITIFQAQRRMYELREEIEEISTKKEKLELIIQENDAIIEKCKKIK